MGLSKLLLSIWVLTWISGVIHAQETFQRVPLPNAVGDASSTAITPDGRFVAVASENLHHSGVPTSDVFLWDQFSDDVKNLTILAPGRSFDPSISTDGRIVAFESHSDFFGIKEFDADDPGPFDTFPYSKVFVYNQQLSWIVEIDQEIHVQQRCPAVSDDGRWVTFKERTVRVDHATGEFSFGAWQVHLVDQSTREKILVSRARLTEAQASAGEAGCPDISGDGRFIVFASWAADMVAGDSNQTKDVFSFDALTGDMLIISKADQPANGLSAEPSISGDGLRVAYQSDASNLVEDDTNDKRDIFLFERTTGETRRVSVRSSNIQANNWSDQPQLSHDGSSVVFRSVASSLSPLETTGKPVLFVWQGGGASLFAPSFGEIDAPLDNSAVGNEGLLAVFLTTATISDEPLADGRVAAYVSNRFGERDWDSDGIKNEFEYSGDLDGDGALNFEDTDSDGDGIPDAVERLDGVLPADSDGDSLPDFLDLDSDNDGLSDTRESFAGPGQNTDGDGLPDYLDTDSDNNGVRDTDELGDGGSTENGLRSLDDQVLVSVQSNHIFRTDQSFSDFIDRASDRTLSNGRGRDPWISGDGRVVAYVSNGSNIVPSDTNDAEDVFIYDHNLALTQAPTLENESTVRGIFGLSADGRRMLYEQTDIWLWDEMVGTLKLPGETAISMSMDGSTVLYRKSAPPYLFAYDLNTRSERPVEYGLSTFLNPSEVHTGFPARNSISFSGSHILSNFDGANLRGTFATFVTSTETGLSEQVTVATDGRLMGGFGAVLDRDGRYVAFEGVLAEDSIARNLLLHDRISRETRAVAVIEPFSNFRISFSGDSRYLDHGRDRKRIDLAPFQDRDLDGLSDALEGFDDPDGDGLTSNLDPDSDGNGIDDAVEAVSNIAPFDNDRDGQADFLDLDDDGDLLPDAWELERDLDRLDASDAGLDPDGNGLSFLEEYLADTDVGDDVDQDGLVADQDNCPLVRNPSQADIDLDDVGDACDDSLPPLIGLIPDLNGDGVPEITGLSNRKIMGGLWISDPFTGEYLGRRGAVGTVGKGLVILKGAGIGFGDAIASARLHNSRNPSIAVTDLASGDLMRILTPRGADWTFKDIAGLKRLAPSGADAIATLVQRRSDNRVRVEVIDPRDKTQLAVLTPLHRGWNTEGMNAIQLGDKPALALWATHESTNLTVVKVFDPLSGDLIKNIFPLDTNWTSLEFKILPDINQNGAEEVAVRMSDIDGRQLIQIRDGLDGGLLSNVEPIGAPWQIEQFESLLVAGERMIATIAVRPSDKQSLVQVRALDGSLVNNAFYLGPPWVYFNGMTVLPDIDGNNVDEIGLLMRRPIDDQRRVQIRDGLSSEIVQNIYQPDY